MKIIKFFIFLVWLFLGFMVFFSAFEDQLILNDKIKRNLNILTPEGWGFFTKNPRDFVLEVYRIDGAKISQIDIKNNSPKYYFGLSREARLIGYEVSTILEEINKKKWVESKTKNIYDHIEDEIIFIKNKNYLNHFKQKNIYMIKVFKPIPYAWSKNNQERFNPFYIIKFELI